MQTLARLSAFSPDPEREGVDVHGSEKMVLRSKIVARCEEIRASTPPSLRLNPAAKGIKVPPLALLPFCLQWSGASVAGSSSLSLPSSVREEEGEAAGERRVRGCVNTRCWGCPRALLAASWAAVFPPPPPQLGHPHAVLLLRVCVQCHGASVKPDPSDGCVQGPELPPPAPLRYSKWTKPAFIRELEEMALHQAAYTEPSR